MAWNREGQRMTYESFQEGGNRGTNADITQTGDRSTHKDEHAATEMVVHCAASSA
jgi:hypothetical protein